ncbi:dihydrofolate reductase [Candidatus Bathyarchaeota archaeon]|nr:MAG: dihydrofolate reductase [Candidatus Bathyarchaeota archaeon]
MVVALAVTRNRRYMRKAHVFMTLSLDGYFEGPNRDISWRNVDHEFNEFAIEQLREADLLLFGRRTFSSWEASWPKAAKDRATSKENLEIAKPIKNTNKIVFSRTLDKVQETENWKSVQLVHEFDPGAIRCLKEQPGKNIWVGGSNLALSFIGTDLIDEFRFMINPVIGEGHPIFEGMKIKLNLELIKRRRFDSGNILLHYKRAKKEVMKSAR